MPLIYNSLESEHLPVQERVLKLVPHLCEILDYGTVQNVLLVKIAIVFTRTRILTVKVQTLDCFRAMVSTLDATTLTTKLVPLLSKIKTKEPSVMLATLSVHEAMGQKVSLEAIATLVLPQLWAMSMGPLLNTDQFTRFMEVIKTLGARVEAEHSKHLREVRKIEEQTSGFGNGGAPNPFELNATTGEVDFESLVKGQSAPAPAAAASSSAMPWDDGWDDLDPAANSMTSSFPGLSISPTPSSPPRQTRPAMSNTSNFNTIMTSSSAPPTRQPSFGAPLQPTTSNRTASYGAPLPPQVSGNSGMNMGSGMSSGGGANYNLSLSPQAPAPKPQQTYGAPLQPQRSPPNYGGLPSMGSSMGGMSGVMNSTGNGSSMMGMMSLPPALPAPSSAPAPQQHAAMAPALAPAQAKAPPGWASGVMQPTQAPKPAWGAAQAKSADWGDFDPLK